MHLHTMRPVLLDELPRIEVRVHTGYVADVLCESVDIAYEFDVRLEIVIYFPCDHLVLRYPKRAKGSGEHSQTNAFSM